MALPWKDVLKLLDWNYELSKIIDMDFSKDCPYTRWMDVPGKRWVFDRNDLVVLAWYPSVGKTEFTFYLATKNADRWVKVLYLTLELTPQYLLERLARKKAWVDKKCWQERSYTEQQREIMNNNFTYLKNYQNIKLVWYKKSPTIDDIETSIRNWKKEWYDLFFIDNLGKISWDQNEIARFTTISDRLQRLKNELWTCIFLLHHMKKPQSGAEYRIWWLSWIRGCQKLSDDSTMVLELWRDLDPDRVEDTTTLTLLKDTMDGYTGKINLIFNKWDYAVRYEDWWDKPMSREKYVSSKWWWRHNTEDYSGWTKI